MAPVQATPGNTAVNGSLKQATDYTQLYFLGALLIVVLMVAAPLWLISTRGDDPNLLGLIALVVAPGALALAQIWGLIQTAEARKENAIIARKTDMTHELVNSGATAATKTLERVAFLEGRLAESEKQTGMRIDEAARKISESNAEFVRAAAERAGAGAVLVQAPAAHGASTPPAPASASSPTPPLASDVKLSAPVNISVAAPKKPPKK